MVEVPVVVRLDYENIIPTTGVTEQESLSGNSQAGPHKTELQRACFKDKLDAHSQNGIREAGVIKQEPANGNRQQV